MLAAPQHLTHFVVVGAGTAGLMTARELARAGKRVTILEARDRRGGRIYRLPTEEFGYPAEGGPEFVHGAAPVTRALMREAGLALQPRGGTRWSTRTGALSPDESSLPHAGRFYQALSEVKADLPIAEFLETHFAGRQYDELRRAITRTVEGYDAADPWRASTLALRDEWMARDDGEHGRIAQGHGELIEYLSSECRRHGAALHLGAAVMAIDEARGGIAVRCNGGATFEADAAILTVPPPLLSEIAFVGGARTGSSHCRYRVRQRRQNFISLRHEVVGRSWQARSGRPVVPAFRRDGPDLVDTASGRISGADRLVRGTQGRRGVVTHRGRTYRRGARLARRDFRSTCGPHQEGSRRVASDQLGQRSVRARRLFLRHPREHAKRSRC